MSSDVLDKRELNTPETGGPKSKIEVNDFNFFYGTFQALYDLTLPIYERHITALIGPSGCGKSTFLRALNRMNDTVIGARAEGEVLLNGQDIYAPNVDVTDLRQRVGMVYSTAKHLRYGAFARACWAGRRRAIWRRSWNPAWRTPPCGMR